MFNDLTDNGLEKQKDMMPGNAGSRFFDTDIYTFKVKMAYGLTSNGGAKGVALTLVEEFSGKEYRETLYVTTGSSKGCKNYYEKDGRRVALPGYELVNDICMMATEKSLSEQTVQEKQVMVWDNESKKEVPQPKPVLTDMIGQSVDLAIVRRTVNKKVNQNGTWVNTADKMEENAIEKAFHYQSNQTLVEALNKQEAVFYNKWIEKNRGVTRDEYKPVDGSAPSAKTSFGSAPTAAQTEERKPLFGSAA